MPILSKAETPNIRLDLRTAGFESTVTLGSLMMPEVSHVALEAYADGLPTLTIDCFVTADTVVEAEVGRVYFRIAGLQLPDNVRRAIYSLLKAEFENPEEGLNV